MDAKATLAVCLKKYVGINNMQRFWFFFYGLPNIMGMGLALLGLLVHIGLVVLSAKGGVMYWAFIVLGLYVFGWLVGYIFENKDADLHFKNAITEEQIKSELEDLLKKIKKRIPKEAYEHVVNIKNAVVTVIPQLLAKQGIGSHDLYTVKKTVFDYLPETLESYMKLPSVYSKVHKLSNGKTADVLLIEQLTVIDTTMQDIVQNIYAEDANKLMTNQRFLEQRMQNTDALFR